MTEDEALLAMTALRQAWAYTPMSDVQARQFKRLFVAYRTDTVRDVLDDLIRIGATRPGPAEMGDLLRGKLGHKAAGRTGARRGEVYLDHEIPGVPRGWAAQMKGASSDPR